MGCLQIGRWSKQKGNTEYRYDPVGNLTNVNYPATADLVFEYDALNRVAKDTRKGVITNTYTYHAGGQLATEATPQWASSTVTLGYTSRLRTSLTLAQPVIGNWTHTYTWDNAHRLDTLTGSSPSGPGLAQESPPSSPTSTGLLGC